MAKRRQSPGQLEAQVSDIRHKSVKRKNIPPAKIAAEGTVPLMGKVEYAYSPRRPPVLRFDADGEPDKLPELLAEATRRPLKPEEARLLAEALRTQQPWLEWAEKRESQATGLTVDPVALHIHERISAQAILRVAARQDVQRDLFADPQQEYHEAVKFYQHDIDWTNRLILGDSLQVMASLARREDLAGKVQMIYIDPPYGIRFGSNFQPEVGKRDVKDNETDLTREPEMVRAYRDTWHLGIHSYLSYLRDRLVAARGLLKDSGSIFVQISDENIHRVRLLLDEVFGPQNFVSLITFAKTTGATTNYLPGAADYLLWYARSIDDMTYHPVRRSKILGEVGATEYSRIELPNGRRYPTSSDELENIPEGSRIYALDNLTSQSMGRDKGEGAACWFPVSVAGKDILPNIRSRWKTNAEGMRRLVAANRVQPRDNSLRYVRYLDDFPVFSITNNWSDTGVSGRVDGKLYVVQTDVKVISRCLLMTTDPGDLVLDPTCGSATTAYVAEQWGRRWITIDTSRVALAIARERLLTAKFDFYRLRDEKSGVAGKFHYKTVPHVTLKSIAQNPNLDPIFARHEPILEACLAACNAALAGVSGDLRRRLEVKLIEMERREGRRSVTDADRRRWQLPGTGGAFQHWTVPFDTDPDWTAGLIDAVTEYRKAWRAKMDEVNACIAANAEQEELVDQPEVVKGVVRVSGPFTVEAVQPPEMSLGDVIDTLSPIGGAPDSLDAFEPARTVRVVEPRNEYEVQNIDAYLDQMVRLLRLDGVRFPKLRQGQEEATKTFTRLERTAGTEGNLHAEGRWVLKGEADADPDGRATVAVTLGPQYGPVTARHVEDAIRQANRRGYDDLVVAGFSFDGPAQAIIAEARHPKLQIHIAHVRPDVNPGMAGLLKEQPGGQLFTVFGMPRTVLRGPDRDGMYTVSMEGVDIYDPVRSVIVSTEDQKVAAWFLDGDYDGRTFCITQAFFPDKTAWKKLSDALDGLIDEGAFEALSGTVSLPFAPGKHRCVAVKVIDPRGNEVMQVHKL